MVPNIMTLWDKSTTFFFVWVLCDTVMFSGIAQAKQKKKKKRQEKIFGRLLHFSEAFLSQCNKPLFRDLFQNLHGIHILLYCSFHPICSTITLRVPNNSRLHLSSPQMGSVLRATPIFWVHKLALQKKAQKVR